MKHALLIKIILYYSSLKILQFHFALILTLVLLVDANVVPIEALSENLNLPVLLPEECVRGDAGRAAPFRLQTFRGSEGYAERPSIPAVHP